MKHYGDITKLHGDTLPVVDIITGGSPCQDLSVAGKRAGLAGERSGLFMEQIRIIKEMRNNDKRNGRADVDIRPRYMVWENVPGALSSNKGEDFRAVLEEAARVAEESAFIPEPPKEGWHNSGCIMGDGFSMAWRITDSQFWGVPQRRRRICLLVDFNGESAPDILFDSCDGGETEETDSNEAVADSRTEPRQEVCAVSEGMSRDSYKGSEKGERTPDSTESCIGSTSKCLNSWDVQSKHVQPESGIAESLYSGECRYGGGESYVMQESLSFQERAGKPGGGKGILIQHEHVGALSTQNIQSVLAGMCLNDQGGSQISVSENVTATLRSEEHGHQPIVFDASRRHDYQPFGDVSETVQAAYGTGGNNQPLVLEGEIPAAYGISAYESNSMKSSNPHSGVYKADTARTLDLNGGSPACNQGGIAIVCLEGNGSRDSHKGDGYKVSDSMFTLNTVEVHGVVQAVDCRNGTVSEVNGPLQRGGIGVSLNTNNVVMESDQKEPTIIEMTSTKNTIVEDGTVPTLTARMGTGGNQVNAVCMSMQAIGEYKESEQASALKRRDYKDATDLVVSIGSKDEQVAGTLDASYYKGAGSRNGEERTVVCYGLDRASYNQGENAQFNFSVEEELASSQTAVGPGAVMSTEETYQHVTGAPMASGYQKLGTQEAANDMYVTKNIVRRLTPGECELLQGFPLGWTSIGEWIDGKGKKHKEADSPRYKAIGNSIALPFWQWLADRIVAQYRRKTTMGSLFDGIGGFPLVFQRAGCEPVWASEIEEFCIAVTKKHFPEGEEDVSQL